MKHPRMVLHVFNSAGGGAALSTLGLIERFRQDGVQSCAVCNFGGTQEEEQVLLEATSGRTTILPLYWWNRKIRGPLWRRPLIETMQLVRTRCLRKSTAAISAWAQRHSADLIHTNTFLIPEGGRAARGLGLPHVWHVRELVGPGTPNPLGRWGNRLTRYLTRNCSKLIANSQASANQIRPCVPHGMLEVVPNGIDLSRFTPREIANERRLVVAMVGNLTSRWKKFGLFVDAALQTDVNLPVEFRIYGSDPSQGGTVTGDTFADELHRRIAARGAQARFGWPGFVADPVAIMNQVDILVNPTETESFGRVVVEAMAAGLPVVGVRGGGVGEIVVHQETGLLAEPGDAATLARHVERLAREPELRRRLGQAGRARAVQQYSLEACAAGVMKVYEQACQRPLTA